MSERYQQQVMFINCTYRIETKGISLVRRNGFNCLSSSKIGWPSEASLEDGQWLWEDVIVQCTSIERENSHEKNDISTIEEHAENLCTAIQNTFNTLLSCLQLNLVLHTSSCSCLANFFSFKTRYKAKSNIKKPWPVSPNMTANKKGKVMRVKRPGLTSRYRAIP